MYKNNETFLNEVHRYVCDSLFSTMRYTSVYKNIIEEKASALLMDEEAVNFYSNNLNVQPDGIKYAASYLRSILNILARYNDPCKDLIRNLKNLKLVEKDDYIDKTPADIVKAFETFSF
jgi:hypothetical protein